MKSSYVDSNFDKQKNAEQNGGYPLPPTTNFFATYDLRTFPCFVPIVSDHIRWIIHCSF